MGWRHSTRFIWRAGLAERQAKKNRLPKQPVFINQAEA